MIHFEKFTLANGLRVIVHEDLTVPVAAMNIVYDVGSRDEHPDKTGFAHLFEHLMFGGSANIPEYDKPLQNAGGSNNAFTSPDVTNYYLTLPAKNIETGFWLESDRMMQLAFSPKSLEVQRKVVIEEFKQRYLNQPYGDIWLKLRPVAYREHPYRWPTIGKEISHIEEATLEEVEHFFYRFYRPNNAVLVVAGGVTVSEVKKLCEKWFAPIPSGKTLVRSRPVEPAQQEGRSIEVVADVPADMLYMAYHMGGKNDASYHATDLLSDILGRGKSSILYQQLVKNERAFGTINAFVMGSDDPGLFVIAGRLSDKTTLAEGKERIEALVDGFKKEGAKEEELLKTKHQAEFSLQAANIELLNRAMHLAFSELHGDASDINREADKIRAVTLAQVQEAANRTLATTNCSTLFYRAKK